MKKGFKPLVRTDSGIFAFVEVEQCLVSDLSDTLSIEAERTMSAVNDSHMLERYISMNGCY